jgi:hypothetical protein
MLALAEHIADSNTGEFDPSTFIPRGGSETRRQAGWRPRFRTIQVCPKDLPHRSAAD